METTTVQLSAQQVPKTRITSGHEDVPLFNSVDLQTVTDQPDQDPQQHQGTNEIQDQVIPTVEEERGVVMGKSQLLCLFYTSTVSVHLMTSDRTSSPT